MKKHHLAAAQRVHFQQLQRFHFPMDDGDDVDGEVEEQHRDSYQPMDLDDDLDDGDFDHDGDDRFEYPDGGRVRQRKVLVFADFFNSFEDDFDEDDVKH